MKRFWAVVGICCLLAYLETEAERDGDADGYARGRQLTLDTIAAAYRDGASAAAAAGARLHAAYLAEHSPETSSGPPGAGPPDMPRPRFGD